MIHYIEYDPATGEGREIDPFKRPDLTAVVRCRDCVHYTYADKEHGNDDWCKKHDHIAWSVNGFCAWGERE